MLKRIACLAIAASFVMSSIALAAEPAKKSARVPRDQATEEDLAQYITETLDDEDEIVGLVPGLKKEKGADGKAYYTFEGVNIVNLSKDKLNKLYSRVQNENARINMERIQALQAQQAQIRQIQALQQMNAQRQVQQAQAIAQSVPPKIPQTPPQPPKAPPAPPPAPSRR